MICVYVFSEQPSIYEHRLLTVWFLRHVQRYLFDKLRHSQLGVLTYCFFIDTGDGSMWT